MKRVGLLLLGLTMVLAGCEKSPASRRQPAESQQSETVEDITTGSTDNGETTTASGIPVSDTVKWKSVNRSADSDIAIAVDTETGCEYIELDNTTVTPRLNSAGMPKCGTN